MPTSPFWSRAMSPASPWMKTPKLGGLEGGELLGEQRGDHPGQDVAGSAGGHAGVAGRVDVIPAPVGHDRPGPLEHHDERLRERGQFGGVRRCGRPGRPRRRLRSAGRIRRDAA